MHKDSLPNELLRNQSCSFLVLGGRAAVHGYDTRHAGKNAGTCATSPALEARSRERHSSRCRRRRRRQGGGTEGRQLHWWLFVCRLRLDGCVFSRRRRVACPRRPSQSHCAGGGLQQRVVVPNLTLSLRDAAVTSLIKYRPARKIALANRNAEAKRISLGQVDGCLQPQSEASL